VSRRLLNALLCFADSSEAMEKGQSFLMQDDSSFLNDALFVPPSFVSASAALSFSDPLPSLPIMLTTRLQLELLLNDSVIDLSAVTEVILGDAGATLQILRLIGEEYKNVEDRPNRMEDCIVSLSMGRCYQVVCGAECSRSGSYIAEWQHCRRIAECARELAKNLGGFSPEEAYLVGLLCRLGKFPHLLGWQLTDSPAGEHEALGVMLACHWNLPDYLLSAIKEQQEESAAPRWKMILLLADQLAEQPTS